MIIPFRIIFLRLRHLKEKMRNLFLRSQCFHKISSTKSKKEDTIYMGIICMSFLVRNLLCKNIYTMPLFMWSNELFSVIYRNNLCLSYREIYFVKKFTPCHRLCGVMNFSVYWNDEYTSIVYFYLVF